MAPLLPPRLRCLLYPSAAFCAVNTSIRSLSHWHDPGLALSPPHVFDSHASLRYPMSDRLDRTIDRNISYRYLLHIFTLLCTVYYLTGPRQRLCEALCAPQVRQRVRKPSRVHARADRWAGVAAPVAVHVASSESFRNQHALVRSSKRTGHRVCCL